MNHFTNAIPKLKIIYENEIQQKGMFKNLKWLHYVREYLRFMQCTLIKYVTFSLLSG